MSTETSTEIEAQGARTTINNAVTKEASFKKALTGEGRQVIIINSGEQRPKYTPFTDIVGNVVKNGCDLEQIVTLASSRQMNLGEFSGLAAAVNPNFRDSSLAERLKAVSESNRSLSGAIDGQMQRSVYPENTSGIDSIAQQVGMGTSELIRAYGTKIADMSATAEFPQVTDSAERMRLQQEELNADLQDPVVGMINRVARQGKRDMEQIINRGNEQAEKARNEGQKRIADAQKAIEDQRRAYGEAQDASKALPPELQKIIDSARSADTLGPNLAILASIGIDVSTLTPDQKQRIQNADSNNDGVFKTYQQIIRDTLPETERRQVEEYDAMIASHNNRMAQLTRQQQELDEQIKNGGTPEMKALFAKQQQESAARIAAIRQASEQIKQAEEAKTSKMVADTEAQIAELQKQADELRKKQTAQPATPAATNPVKPTPPVGSKAQTTPPTEQSSPASDQILDDGVKIGNETSQIIAKAEQEHLTTLARITAESQKRRADIEKEYADRLAQIDEEYKAAKPTDQTATPSTDQTTSSQPTQPSANWSLSAMANARLNQTLEKAKADSQRRQMETVKETYEKLDLINRESGRLAYGSEAIMRLGQDDYVKRELKLEEYKPTQRAATVVSKLLTVSRGSARLLMDAQNEAERAFRERPELFSSVDDAFNSLIGRNMAEPSVRAMFQEDGIKREPTEEEIELKIQELRKYAKTKSFS